ncbi:major facilitator superfamily domain-containing protein [Xylogone sp. PMI_703]|nr:major facilitator superfamily domain-containing protein [Xylogone sp. PMI_703]
MSRVSERTSLLRNGGEPWSEEDGETSYENIVWWDGEDDPANPMNWNEGKKWSQVAIIAVLTFLIPLGATMFAPGVKQAMEDLQNTNDVLAPLAVSIYILGWALGPLVVAPLSEVQGRWIVYSICNILFVVFTAACALSRNVIMLITFRFLAGAVGSAPLTIGGGSISDMIPVERRGLALSLFMLGPVLGPSIGPALGGWITSTFGWTWIFWVLSTMYGIVTIVALFSLRETYAPTILKWKTKAMIEETCNIHLRSKLDSGLSSWQVLAQAIIRPTKVTFLSPINVVLSLAAAFMNGTVFILLTTLPMIFEKVYGFSATESGLAFLGFGAGNIIGLFTFTATSDRFIRARAAEGKVRPEYRLIHVLISAPLVAVGLFIYGWSAQLRMPWIVPVLSSGLIGMANILFSVSLVGYLVDAFNTYSASVIAGNTVVRSIGGTLLPIVGTKLFQTLGLGWGNSVLGLVAIIFTPMLFVLYAHGQSIRGRYPVKL